MSVSRHTVFVTALMIGCSILTGCATAPDQQEPIALKAGTYAISMNGSMLGFAAKESSSNYGNPKSVCLDGTDDQIMHRLSSLVTKLMPSNADCSTGDAGRRGNAISAASSCPLHGEYGSGTIKIAFDGVVAAEAVEGAYSFKVEDQQVEGDAPEQARGRLAMASLGAMKLNVHLARTGDCTAETRSNPWGA